ncbi:hypothetical protein SCATT_p00350 (plasmid) [Streptantibioticus cattleyicolor NRRL 8057 = DSM 46488]|uniref:Uncharacterized protein n=1 Tax=Streptantibioticus cattleyicolor (strain ATCC 35852 / DSM 46488 / JCM 4925 / NBRC 14057 / NRRL 8057) TaxID=1003195 RepID=G8XDN4_STREN|nr:hypothetical protein SCATT_p00350 [Streptantibioticus cattleyicolor NRRL 8057 = DSM 46488]
MAAFLIDKRAAVGGGGGGGGGPREGDHADARLLRRNPVRPARSTYGRPMGVPGHQGTVWPFRSR